MEPVNIETLQARNAELEKQLVVKNRQLEIEAALERVRTRAMSMHRSEELFELLTILIDQFDVLGIGPEYAHLSIIDPLTNSFTFRISGSARGRVLAEQIIDINASPVWKGAFDNWKTGEYYVANTHRFPREVLPETWKLFTDLLAKVPEEFRVKLEDFPNGLYVTEASCKYGFLGFGHSRESTAEEKDIVVRFVTEFERSYQRFLDLQKAEAQAREATIELGLERVRARAMAMHSSNELKELVKTLFEEFTRLDFNFYRCMIWICDPLTLDARVWMANPETMEAESLLMQNNDDPFYQEMLSAWKERNANWIYTLEGDKLKNWTKFLFTETEFSLLPNLVKDGMQQPDKVIFWASYYNYGGIQIGGPEPFSEQKIKILSRFSKVFDMSYTRFLDLQKAEAQAREAQIELGLERVRARAMAMQNSEELKEVVKTLFEELTRLDVKLATCLISTFNATTLDVTSWMFHPVTREPYVNLIRYNEEPFYHEMLNAWKERNANWTYGLEGDAKIKWENFLFSETEFSLLPQVIKDEMRRPDKVHFSAAYYNYGAIQAAGLEPFSQQNIDILQRFSKVFDLSYTRFLDLQKAEAHAREAYIEMALEKVRSRSLAMHKSDELKDVVNVVFQKLLELDMVFDGGAIIVIFSEDSKDLVYWISSDLLPAASGFRFPYFDHPLVTMYADARERGIDFFTKVCFQETKNSYYKYAFKHSDLKYLADDLKNYIFESPGIGVSVAQSKHSAIVTPSFSAEVISEQKGEVLTRFAQVFEQAYVRFLDLQKAEAQAREAQIELGLERVRARAMAMQKSNELAELVDTVFKELTKLDFALNWCIINIIDESSMTNTVWAANPDIDKSPESYYMKFEDYPFHHAMMKGYKEGSIKYVYVLEGQEKKIYDQYLFNETEFRRVPAAAQEASRAKEKYVVTFSFSNFGGLQTVGVKPLSEASLDVLSRFGKVFDLTYTRFNDLQKAEAQAREAKIEASLEKVRSRSLAMHKAEELGEVVAVVVEKMRELELPVDDGVAIVTHIEGSKDQIEWLENPGFPSAIKFYQTYFDHPILSDYWRAKNEGVDFIAPRYTAEESKSFLDHIFEFTDYKHTPQQIKDYCLAAKSYSYSAAFQKNSSIFINDYSGRSLSGMQIDLVKRFSKVFEQAYVRFLDLQKAEAQAREAQIEAALERVRSRAMAMHKTDELLDAGELVYKELSALGIISMAVSYAFVNEEEKNALYYGINPVDGKIPPVPFVFPHTETEVMRSILSSWKKQESFNVIELDEKATLKHQTWVGEHIQTTFAKNKIPFSVEGFLEVSPQTAMLYTFNFTQGYIFIIGEERLTTMQEEMVLRFTKVFEMTYRRFLDLQKAEAQAREAQIETALEKVRSRSLAMHTSNELNEVVRVAFEKLQELNIETDSTNIHIYKDGTKDLDLWIATPAQAYSTIFHLPYFNGPFHNDYYSAKEKGLDFVVIDVPFEEKNAFFRFQFEHSDLKHISEDRKKLIIEGKQYSCSIAITKNAAILINSYSGKLFSEKENEILKRFAKVFEQAFTRFIDLQKAEAQAREAKIEAALERTRTQSMIMQHSKELDDTLRVFHGQVLLLGINSAFSYLWLPDEEKEQHIFWAAWAEQQNGSTIFKSKALNYPLDRNEPATAKCLVDWKSDVPVHSYPLAPGEVENYFANWAALLDGVEKLKPAHFPGGLYYVEAYMKYGCFGVMIESELSEDEKKILGRFAIEFERAYTRFLDLQKAEAQARKAKIEAALERVRGKAMAMHGSEDLTATIVTFYHELELFSITPRRCGVGLLNKENRISELSTMNSTVEGNSIELIGKIDLTVHPVLEGVYENWLVQKEYYPVLRGNEIKKYYQVVRPQIAFPDYPDDDIMFGYFFFFPEGGVYAWTDKKMAEDELIIYRRFTSVLSLTYKRYKDLKDAEASVREAVKQAVLDRIRADIASMRTISDLDRITPLIWNELNILGIPFIRCGVFIMDDAQQLIHTFLSTPDGKAIAAFHLPYDAPGNLGLVLSHWRDKKNYIDHWNEVDFAGIADILLKQGSIATPEQYIKTLPQGGFYLHFLPFLQGMLYVGNINQLGQDEIELLQHVADAFSTAYARYEDFTKLEAAKQIVDKTLVDLKQAQQQLVQSEKMASLGELTAGIAHEIQNPLNFVNNFSEVNAELIDEIKQALQQGNSAEVLQLAEDIKKNLEKINFHGKRADGIVKSMLQHSRSSDQAGKHKKEPTDINVLADEYLRLAYHGLRAKDNAFNATLKTDFDESIGLIEVVGQDIGRAILNLITNAFYAIHEKDKRMKQEGEPYSPLVSVTTKRTGKTIEIRVEDNGPGIPQHVLDKIFQPFFTTKPTGQGTGLGLSLAYDIIKAHQGELKVVTKEARLNDRAVSDGNDTVGQAVGRGEGSEFIIQLPTN